MSDVAGLKESEAQEQKDEKAASKKGTAVEREAKRASMAKAAHDQAAEQAIEAQAAATEESRLEWNDSEMADVHRDSAEADRIMALPSPEAIKAMRERDRQRGPSHR